MPPDFDTAYRAMRTRDTRFDGRFVTAVTSTGIYCRPGCPSRTPKPENVRFYAAPAAAQAAGFRACRRCLPDAAPGSPEWNSRRDTVGAAMRLIADGVIDREGVTGLAARLGYSERHVTRLVTDEVGASPLTLARAKRADTARLLLTSTALPISDIAFAAGFSSIRQFNDTMTQIYALTPTALRQVSGAAHPASGRLTLRLAVRSPFHGDALLGFLAARAVPGVEAVRGRYYARTLRLPAGTGTVVLTLPESDGRQTGTKAFVTAHLDLQHLSDLAPAVDRCRRLIDADADPVGIESVLAADPLLARAVAAAPGLRLPGAVDGPEILIRALIGQQISVAAARTKLADLARLADERVGAATDPGAGHGGDVMRKDTSSDENGDEAAALAATLTHLFPSPAALTALGTDAVAGPRRRAETVAAAAADMASGALVIDAGRQAADLTEQLVARPGIGPWTAGYVSMRVLGDPDVLLTGDLALRHGAEALGMTGGERPLGEYGARWAPFRSYAGMHLWRACPPPTRRRTPDAPTRPQKKGAKQP